jgi:hypothetical protein
MNMAKNISFLLLITAFGATALALPAANCSSLELVIGMYLSQHGQRVTKLDTYKAKT